MTERDDRQADLLDQYWSRVAAAGDPTPPAGMEESVAATALAVHRELRTEAPQDAFVERLRQRIEESADGPSEQRRAAWWSGSIPRQAASGLLAIALATLAIVVGLARGGDGAASAAEILRAASSAAASPQTVGVQSFEMTAVSLSVLQPPPPIDALDLGDDVVRFQTDYLYRSHIWYQAPDRQRTETVNITWETTAGEGQWPVVQVWSGTERTIYFAASGKAQIFELYESDVRRWLRVGWPGPENLEALLEDAARCYDQPSVTGEETIAGRRTHVIELGQARCGPYEGMRRVIWIDQETAFVLKHEQYRRDGELSSRVEVTSIDYNVSIDPARFEFTPPPGVEVEDMRR